MLALDPGYDPRIIGLGIALAIGFVIGLEREWAEDKPVGVRSFALIAAFIVYLLGAAAVIGYWLAGLLAAAEMDARHGCRCDGGRHGIAAVMALTKLGSLPCVFRNFFSSEFASP